MAWIKRNLFFVIGSLVALGLMGGAGFYTWTRWQANTKAGEELNQAYEELKRLNQQNPHPGDGKRVDNIKLAKAQQEELRQFLGKTTTNFKRITPVPEATKVTGAEFASALRLTIAQLQREATNNSVTLPQGYNYSFEAQRQQPFLAGNLDALAVQLGEVKVISDILTAAKINALLSIRRERVSSEDNSGPPTDYLDIHSETNDLAVLTPYEISFQSFSTELASVISGLANSPYAILMKSINVRPAAAVMLDPSMQPVPQFYVPTPGTTPGTMPGRMLPSAEMSERDAFRSRYGIGGGSASDLMRQRYGIGGGGKDAMRYAQPQPVAPVAPVPVAGAAPKGGLQPMLDERQLDVTIVVKIVKLLPAKTEVAN
jgi:hypothetical protein